MSRKWPYPTDPPVRSGKPEGLRARRTNRSKSVTQGHARLVGGKGRQVRVPPPVADGYARCPVCRNKAVTP